MALFMAAFIAGADTLGRLFIRPDFHASEVMFGTAMAFVGAAVGVNLLTGKKK